MKKTIKNIFLFILASFTISCGTKLPETSPDVITQTVKYDTDDPAIWINKENPAESIVFGTDKNADGAVYAFDLQGNIIEEKSIRNIDRPNNVDIEYGFKLNDSTTTDIMIFTERFKEQIRVFSVPDMKPLDNGGITVFNKAPEGEFQAPMGVAIYKSPKDGSFYAIVGRKNGPENNYFHQYKLETKEQGKGISATLVRKFGQFSGIKEIEAIAVDDAAGFVYYSDEGHCIRKYYAEPSMGNKELACFGQGYFKRDNEGIAILAKENGEGYIIVSNQSNGTFAIFSRKTNEYIKDINLGTTETDGIEVINFPLNKTFQSGLFVAMNDEKNFFFYDLEKLSLGKMQQQDLKANHNKENLK